MRFSSSLRACPVPGVLALGLLLMVLPGCATSRTYVASDYASPAHPPDAAPVYRLFLVGNIGDLTTGASPAVFPLLQRHLAEAGPQSALVLLGDQVGPGGLPDSSDARRAQAEAPLLALRDLVASYPGTVRVLPGEQDGGYPGPATLPALRRLETFLNTLLDRDAVVQPQDGFPGPVALELTDGLVLLMLGTPWWLIDEGKPYGDTGTYDLHEAGDVLQELDQLLTTHRNDRVIVVGHHPLFSNGPHGGRFPLRAHLRPVPVVGSVQALYRSLIGRSQDLADASYRTFRRELMTRFAPYDGLIYAGAHDRSLQYVRDGSARVAQHYLVSGSAAGPGAVAPGGGARFVSGQPGFLSLQLYADRSIWLEAWAVTPEAPSGTRLFQTRLADPDPAPSAPDDLPITSTLPLADSMVTRAANPAYRHDSRLHTRLLGAHWRQVWATPVQAPVFDLAGIDGGLRPVKAGGRGQSVSIRFEAPRGRQYVLRSLDKEAGRAWPSELRATFAHDLTQDQFAMLHPYAAFLLPPLAEAAGIYHTNPRLVYVPDDPRLGRYRTLLRGELALFEERPDEDMSDVASMGHAREVVSTWTMLEETTADNDHRIDARFFARSRLFDMLISDWDRHEDQWRWAAFEPHELDPGLTGDARTQGKIYRPIPRDRDVALMRMNGLLPSLARMTALPQYQDFRDDYGYLKGLNQNGLALDRRYTPSLTRSDWVALADSIRLALTDARIEAAVALLPDSVYTLTGPTLIYTFKARRDQLPAVAAAYYETLAAVVDVVGSHKHERFEVRRVDDRSTEVVMLKTSKEGEIRRELFRRVFHHDETREVRLYGLGGNDTFEVTGDAGTSLRVIAVGGPGHDTFSDASRVRGLRRMTQFYDSPDGDTWTISSETRVVRSRDPRMNGYDLHAYRHDRTYPVVFFGFNKDDGVFIGGGATYTRHGFRREPFAQQHTVKANVAAATQAFNLRYLGHVTDVLRSLDLSLEADVSSPNQIRNFYGLGNATTNDDRDARYYQARLSEVRVASRLHYQLGDGIDLALGPHLSFTDVREDTSRFIGQPQAGISATTFDHQWHAGVQGQIDLTDLDSPIRPLQGYRWTSSAAVNLGLRRKTDSYGTLTSALSVYVPVSYAPQITLAARVGGAHTIGSFPFFAATTLGGSENLRGVRSTRFAGRSSFYQNLELRLRLTTFASYLAFGELGLLGFVDNGRVWADGDDADPTLSQSFFEDYHQGIGGGLWLQLYGRSVLTLTTGFSEGERALSIQFGFLY